MTETGSRRFSAV